jgi:hypothetical protein
MLRMHREGGLTMGRILGLGTALLAGIFSSLSTGAIAQDIDPEAQALLLRSAEFLAGKQRFRFVTEIEYDVRQDSGALLEFGARRATTIQRPQSVRVEAESRDGNRSLVIFDGRQIALLDRDENVYATAERTGNIDEIVDFVRNDLETPVPLSEMIDTRFPKLIRERVQTIYSAGVETLHGKRCEHLAAEGEAVDAQFWIALDGEPLPCRIVLTYKRAEGNPQFRAEFVEWDLAPKLSAELFRFEPPKDAERIPFLLPARQAPAAEPRPGASR